MKISHGLLCKFVLGLGEYVGPRVKIKHAVGDQILLGKRMLVTQELLVLQVASMLTAAELTVTCPTPSNTVSVQRITNLFWGNLFCLEPFLRSEYCFDAKVFRNSQSSILK